MKTRLISVNATIAAIAKTFTTLLVVFSLSACGSIPVIVPQLPQGGSPNSAPVIGADIAQANEFLRTGQKRDAAAAYFSASQNYRSPERERLILQAAELASVFNDPILTQRYLSPLNFDRLSPENKTRFRLTQAQLALNDRNYRETLRILPQRINNIPEDLGQKVLATRMTAAQASGDKLALVQELVLQETTLKESHQVSLNHDRIWNHSKQIPAFQLEEAKNSIGHPIVRNWLELAQLSRIASNGPANKKQTLRGDLGRWIQNNNNHPGMSKALGLLNASPTTTVTPYSLGAQRPVAKKPVANRSVITSTIEKRPVVKSPVVKKIIPKRPVVTTPKVKPPAVKSVAKKAVNSNVKSLYENAKKQINKTP